MKNISISGSSNLIKVENSILEKLKISTIILENIVCSYANLFMISAELDFIVEVQEYE